MWISTQRSETRPRQESWPVRSRSGAAAVKDRAKATSSRQAAHAAAISAGSPVAASKSASGHSGVA